MSSALAGSNGWSASQPSLTNAASARGKPQSSPGTQRNMKLNALDAMRVSTPSISTVSGETISARHLMAILPVDVGSNLAVKNRQV